MGQKSARKLIEQISRSRKAEFWRVLYGLGIRHVGERVAQAFATAFGSIDGLLASTVEAMQRVHDIGPVAASSVRRYLDEPHNVALIERLRTAGVRLAADAAAPAGSQTLQGLAFVITGRLAAMTRDEAGRAIVERGGRVGASVSKKTSYVVAGTDPGSTLAKAQALGVAILDEGAFARLIMEK
jgi:DNA ligase (NAD+)